MHVQFANVNVFGNVLRFTIKFAFHSYKDCKFFRRRNALTDNKHKTKLVALSVVALPRQKNLAFTNKLQTSGVPRYNVHQTTRQHT